MWPNPYCVQFASQFHLGIGNWSMWKNADVLVNLWIVGRVHIFLEMLMFFSSLLYSSFLDEMPEHAFLRESSLVIFYFIFFFCRLVC